MVSLLCSIFIWVKELVGGEIRSPMFDRNFLQ